MLLLSVASRSLGASFSYSTEGAEEEFSEVRVAPALHERASYI